MTNTYFIQLVGILLTLAGIVALTASARLFGTPLTRDEQERHAMQGDSYRLPINWTTLASGAFFLGGIGILTWSKFSMCSFLLYWIPNLPDAFKLFMSCR